MTIIIFTVVDSIQLETEKNRLELLLNSNLLKKLERLQSEIQEMTSVDRKQKLELQRADLEAINKRHSDVAGSIRGGWKDVLLRVA